jgi:hypothetical protein
MKTSNNILTALTSLCLGALLTSCASTHVTGAWKVPHVAQVAPQRVLVLAVLGSATSRRAIEDEVVRQLSQAGVNAIAGYSISPDTTVIPQPRLAQTLADCGADAALVCRWQVVRQTTYARADSSTEAASPGRVRQTAYGEATLLGGSALGTLWSAATTTDQPGGFRDAAPEYAKNLVNALQDDGALCYAKAKSLPMGDLSITSR